MEDPIFKEILESLKQETDIESINQKIYNFFGGNFIFTTIGHKSIFYRISPQHDALKKYPNKKNDPNSFSYNPNPELGRANLTGKPIFYCSISPSTTILEKKDIVKNEKYFISAWEIDMRNFNIVNFTYCTRQHLGYLSKNIGKKIKDISKELTLSQEKTLQYKIKRITDLFCSVDNSYYNITSAIATKQLNNKKLNAPILLYPSFVGHSNDYNLAINTDLIDNKMYCNLISVIECTIQKNEKSADISILSKATNNNGKLKWNKFSYFSKVEIFLYRNSYYIEINTIDDYFLVSNKRMNFEDYLIENTSEQRKYKKSIDEITAILDSEPIYKYNQFEVIPTSKLYYFFKGNPSQIKKIRITT